MEENRTCSTYVRECTVRLHLLMNFEIKFVDIEMRENAM